jgi:TRAP-type mannitol/chloroaromatic compound transport system permease small subunit
MLPAASSHAAVAWLAFGGPACGHRAQNGRSDQNHPREILSLQSLLTASGRIDAFNTWLGRWLSWAVLVAVIISAVNATVRKIFDTSSNSFLELQWVLFSLVFLLCSPWALLKNEHIRIDIINFKLPLKVRSWIDLIGHIFFLLPFTIILLWTSIPFFLNSYRINEQSFSAGGLPQWPAKSLIMAGMALLFVQGVSELIKRLAVMRGIIPDPNAHALDAHAAAEAEAERLVMHLSAEEQQSGEPPPPGAAN